MAIENGHKLANQMRKAMKLVAAIDRGLLAKGVDVYDQAGAILLASRDWSEGDWQRLADAADVNPPSVETQRIVQQIYRDRARTGVRPFPRLAS
jgi:hypothetical protein